MTQQEFQEQNNRAYLLHTELLKTAERFCKNHRGTSGNAIMGAGVLYLTGYIAPNAPSREEAHKAVDENARLMHSLIDQTPDSFLGMGQKAKWN